MQGVNDTVSVTGDVTIVKNGTETYKYKNLVVTVGKTYIASRMASNTTPVMSHMAIGQGNTAATVSNTTLGTELARSALTVTGGTPSANVVTYSAFYGSGVGTGAITEAGVFNSGTVGTMLCRTVFPPVNKGALDSITVTWAVSIV
jgi:hypothetical protein